MFKICFEPESRNEGSMFKIYDESGIAKCWGVFKILVYDEPESPMRGRA